MTCTTCTHFLPDAFSLATSAPGEKWDGRPEGTGICRRYPPRYFLPAEDSDGYSIFPSVHRGQVCGEFNAQHSGIPI